MPTPVSVTEITEIAGLQHRASTRMRPRSGVNFTALPSRLMRICLRRSGSARMRRQARRHGGFDRDVLFAGLGLDDEQAGGEDGREVDRLAIDRELAGLDLRDVENAVDEGEEVFGRLLDVARILLDLFRCRHRLGVEHVGKADDGVERGAQFMAHVGDEFGLGLGGQFGVDLGGVERDRLLLLGDGHSKMIREFANERAILEPFWTKCTHHNPCLADLLGPNVSMAG